MVNQMTNTTDNKATKATKAIDPIKAQIDGLKASIKALEALGLDTSALVAQAQGLKSQGLKTDFYSKVAGLGKAFIESGIKVITLSINDDGNISIQYGQITRIGESNPNAAAKPLLNIVGEKPILNKGKWIDRVIDDIRAIPEYKNKTDAWIKDNREEVFKVLASNKPDKFSIPA